MSRSAKKGPYIDAKLQEKIDKQKASGDRSVLKTWARRSQVSPDFVGHKLAIHDGRRFVEIFVSEGMVGHRLGEFALSRTFRTHGKVTKRVLEKT
jgi:small subunit ribosomal protein S19